MSQLAKTISSILLESDAVLLMTGAGFGVDSGLPDFRGSSGLWNQVPNLRHKSFFEMANPQFLTESPEQFWAFYGLRYNMYKRTQPHEGFQILRDTLLTTSKPHFVVTSNVDGHFQKAGFNEKQVYEIHGSINYFQCTQCQTLSKAIQSEIQVDLTQFKANVPTCKKCQSALRPNILMFDDWEYISQIRDQQEKMFKNFLQACKEQKKLCILEFGAGTVVPTIRSLSEKIVKQQQGASLVRVNIKESNTPSGQNYYSVPKSALEFLKELKPFLI